MTMHLDLNGKIAIITGAGGGLGEAIARGLSSAGAAVVIADIDMNRALLVANAINAKGGNAIAVQVDVSDNASVYSMVNSTVDKYGTIDILVNNAGINLRNPCINMGEEEWDKVININLKGTFLCCRAAGKIMIKQGKGKVINIASLLATVAQPNRGPYAASKGGLVQLTKVLALEWAPHNINVNAVGPGYVLTELNRQLTEDPITFNDISAKIPMGRWANPDEIVGPVVFLASSASDYITGHVLYVDGGYLCM